MPKLPTSRTLGYTTVGVAALGFAFYRMEDFKTPGAKNIERRHSAAGGADTHTPAGGTKMGDEQSVEGKQETDKGVSSSHYQKNHGEQGGEPSELAKKWNRTQHGGDKGRTGLPKNP